MISTSDSIFLIFFSESSLDLDDCYYGLIPIDFPHLYPCITQTEQPSCSFQGGLVYLAICLVRDAEMHLVEFRFVTPGK